MRGTEAAIWVDEFDFSSATGQIDVSFEVGEAERTSLASEAQEFLPLLSKCTVTQNGYFEGVLPGGFERELETRFGDGRALVTVLLGRSVLDCVAYVLPAATNYNMTFSAPVSGLVTLNGQWGTSAGAVRGRRVFDGTFTAVGESVPVDLGAGTTRGGHAFLHVAGITGVAGTVEIRIESSANQIDWDDEGSFFFSSVGGYRVALTGTIGRYVRLACIDLGGATVVRCMSVIGLNA